MFARLLVANRGEIACRIFRTARRLGISTVAVYSEADVGARHVREAEEGYLLGPAPPRESYLSIERLLDVARRAGVDAVHPGYGFLAENAGFAAACERAGIAFIGPPAAAIEAMGSKRGAKDMMRRSGVPVLTGYHGADQTLETLEHEGIAVGFPLIVKPSAGGGGKGMQIVEHAANLPAALVSARRVAESAFGSGELVLERYLRAPRHVEVQVLADAHGRCAHVFDRDCSVQRRHQKLIEEAPAPGIALDVRERLHAAAVKAAQTIGYVSAGTVEFLYEDREFWFMEMNTRLQVEHPVTEMITGLDLVEWQLRIAAGEPLTWSPPVAGPTGHAIEVRVCAEDPAHDFSPSSGRLQRLDWPVERAGIRVDAGFATGDAVPSYYDSLLGKVIAHAPTRTEAAQRLSQALDEIRIVGVRSTEEWLQTALRHSGFLDASPTTRFIEHHGPELAPTGEASPLAAALAAVWIAERGRQRDGSPWEDADGFRIGLPRRQLRSLMSDERKVDVVLELLDNERWQAAVESETFTIASLDLGASWRVDLGDRQCLIDVTVGEGTIHLWGCGPHAEFSIYDPRAVSYQSTSHEGALTTPLPGTVAQVLVAAEDDVTKGQALLVIEAMKMEHTIVAPHAGRVIAVHFAAGERVSEGAVLLELTRE